jgi:hypothetical protein
MGEPGVEEMVKFCRKVVPTLLGEVCSVDDALADAIGADILRRARGFVALDRPAQETLAAPFIEDVIDYEPVEASVHLKSATAVIMRNSLLEQAHARGQVDDGGMTALTTLGARALSQFLRNNGHLTLTSSDEDIFGQLHKTFPRAWAALSALSSAVSRGGRIGHRAPDAPAPSWPDANTIVSARRSAHNADIVVQSAIDTDMNDQLVEILHEVVDNKTPLFVPSLSRISRNMDVSFYVIELLLANGAQILTTNYWLRTSDVWVRKGQLLAATIDLPTYGLDDLRGLSGSHRKVVEDVAKSIKDHPDA